MINPSEVHEVNAQEEKLKSLLSVERNSQKIGAQRQQDIMQGVRWLVTLQAFIRLYLVILPSVFINVLGTVVKPNKGDKNGN